MDIEKFLEGLIDKDFSKIYKKKLDILRTYYDTSIKKYKKIQKGTRKTHSIPLKKTQLSSEFTPKNVVSDIVVNFDSGSQTNFSINPTSKITVSYFWNKMYPFKKRMLDKIENRVLFLPVLSELSENFTIDIYNSRLKKLMPNDEGKYIGTEHVNSGVTTSYFNHSIPNHTVVFRDEELLKLIIHELIHNLNFDYGLTNFKIDFHELFNVQPNYPLVINEAYTETVACILNSVLVCIEKKTLDFRIFKSYILRELLFNLYQTSKILNYFKIFDSRNLNKPWSSDTRFKQKSNVLAYFFIKTALLFCITKFVEFTNIHSNNFYIKDKDASKSAFVKLMIECVNDCEYLDALNYFISLHANHKFPVNKKMKETLRMTIIE